MYRIVKEREERKERGEEGRNEDVEDSRDSRRAMKRVDWMWEERRVIRFAQRN